MVTSLKKLLSAGFLAAVFLLGFVLTMILYSLLLIQDSLIMIYQYYRSRKQSLDGPLTEEQKQSYPTE